MFQINKFHSSIHKIIRLQNHTRSFSLSIPHQKSMKVAILGAAGKTGTSLSLFLKQSPLIDELSLYDIKSVRNIDLELNAIDMNCKVTSNPVGTTGLKRTLQDSNIVLITAGKKFYTSNNISATKILNENATILKELLPSVIEYCPEAMIAIATSPINSLIPMAVEYHKKAGVLRHNHIFGITTLDCMRANSFFAEYMGTQPEHAMVPVIGGSCPETCIPVFSKAKPSITLDNDEYFKLICNVKRSFADSHKNYPDQLHLSLAMGYSISKFCTSLCKALMDKKGVVDYAYVRSCIVPEVTYFSGPLELGPRGVRKYLDLPEMNDRESRMLRTTKTALKKDIRQGERLVLDRNEVSTETCASDPPNQHCKPMEYCVA